MHDRWFLGHLVGSHARGTKKHAQSCRKLSVNYTHKTNHIVRNHDEEVASFPGPCCLIPRPLLPLALDCSQYGGRPGYVHNVR